MYQSFFLRSLALVCISLSSLCMPRLNLCLYLRICMIVYVAVQSVLKLESICRTLDIFVDLCLLVGVCGLVTICCSVCLRLLAYIYNFVWAIVSLYWYVYVPVCL